MPSLTVRAMAEMLRLPAYAQARILMEQKYPRSGPQVFRTPYYQPALSAIRSFFRYGRRPAIVESAITNAGSINLASKRLNNIRVMESFLKSDLASRNLHLKANIRLAASEGDVELRLTPDLQALEDDEERIFFLNCRGQRMEPEVAKVTCEISHWVLEMNGISVPINSIEYIDLFSNVSYSLKRRRPTTIRDVGRNAQIIDALWPTL